MKKYIKGIGFYVLLFAVIIFIFTLLNYQSGPKEISFSELVNYINKGSVTQLQIDENNQAIAVIKEGKGEKETTLVADIPDIEILYQHAGDQIKKQVSEESLKLVTPQPSPVPWWLSMLPSLILTIIIIAFWIMFFRQSQGGGTGKAMSFGKSRARVSVKDKDSVTFKDVAGADVEKAELAEIVEFLRAPQKFTALGAKIPKGVLLVGPPGTGKTLLAKAVAGEADVPFFSISGSDFVEMFVGVGASRVRDLFEQAKKAAPSIIFIDEIDAVGRQRGAGLGGGHDEREQTLNQLLVEMDGFGANVGVIVIAATNRPDILDSALLRPGRFDRQVVVDVPDIIGREAILKVHSRKKPLGSDVDLSVIAKTTAGFTGADLANLLNEAALLAARKSKTEINMQEIEDAMIKVVVGTEKKTRNMSEHEKKLTAYHEAGHAIITRLLPSQDPVHQVSIIPRGRAGGFTMSLPSEDKYYNTKGEMIDSIIVLLGGRSAEALTLNDISTGASNDIQRASKIARDMVTKYGMSDKIGPICFGNDHDEVFIGRDFVQSRNMSEHVSAEIDEEIRDIIDTAYERCKTMLTQNMDKLRAVAEVLIEREKISGEEFEKVFNGEKLDGLKFEGVSEDTAVSAEENTENSDNSSNSENTGADDTDTNA
ncbi:ATP-dependent zinc metalloprotease FtsH [Qingrenia yutianensis]|uniref:ATP-dependent zinc metalloprotease FtsH n=1 Tax=Qingrenia yutianensis TaxID=2763676 RepID=A0A926F695_9FIRM|nr:ATP-dependent zinc metalloprotease FtsH [Qingrenia yutianensis]MBC8595496.1 ATP-dependent metallopeptidase FtsH/Yme1/Tma family protein [Qingrenia yutianensis]